MHFRFGHSPGEVDLDDIRVTEVDTGRDVIPPQAFEGGDGDFTGRWTVWPPGPKNTVGTVRGRKGPRTRQAPADCTSRSRRRPAADWPDFHVYHRRQPDARQGAALPGEPLGRGPSRLGT